MSNATFRALVLEQEGGEVRCALREVERSALPEGEVLIKVAYSSVNYKDGLALHVPGRIVRRYPMVPGIDLAGVVEESTAPDVRPGDPVIVTGWGIGERHWGGYAQYARVKAEWVVPLPQGLDLKQAMAIGTAGFTAMLCVMALEEHGVVPGEREVVVTGAAGGVGSIAVALLAQLGYRVVASTGRPELHDYLRFLGAQRILDRRVLATPSGKALDSEQWAGAVDTVGGETLAGLLRSVAYGGSVAACGLAGGSELTTTVFPFILRGVNLLGIDSVYCPRERREQAWQRLARDLPLDKLEAMTHVVSLEEAVAVGRDILQGKVRGRVVVDVNA
ncbi:acrylyl-CoA reductase (NADPH) [Calditerricola satsumensis]|uniref:Quinone oxidoreductase n=1 Tax=Calditerricola satsumensis TaxID=373054 RepID=A0A8J3BBC8_9BACI|nr:MDR family oxidoreductase [Calditerricola satsumensis]GGK06841.1 quinone oxidoreductase [Calditerricola satsumensis]